MIDFLEEKDTLCFEKWISHLHYSCGSPSKIFIKKYVLLNHMNYVLFIHEDMF